MTAVGVGEVVSKVREALRAYEATSASDLPSTARPSAGTCRWCAYRLVCRPYWNALDTTWEQGSLAGTLGEIQSNSRGTTALIDGESPVDAPGPGWLVTAIPHNIGVGVGPVTMVDAELTGASRHLRWRWSTLVWAPNSDSGVRDVTH